MNTVAGGATEASSQEGDPPSDGLPLSPRARSGIGLALFTALIYIPILAMQPGKVDADTKTYLYLDPARFLARAASIWDPSIGLGTLSHQTIGYLFPMGPFYWILEDVLGLPAWVAQRLWLGSLILLAGLGVRYLLRALGAKGAGVPIAMLAYAFTPYVLGYSAIYSVILSPWTALPWWIAFVVLAMRKGGWKYPALFALTVQLAGALNGSALLFSLIGPALYIPYAVLVAREASWRRAWTVVWRIGILSFLTSLWWFIPLAIEGQYGMNILRFTESIEIVSKTSLPFEVLRGLGNWFFYGKDRVGLWADARVDFTQRSLFILVSMAIPTLALVAAGVLRWRNRAYFVLLALVGVGIAVGAEPYANPSILGGLFKNWALASSLGFALRNTGRATPLVVLSFSVLLGVGVSAFVNLLRARRLGAWALGFAVLVGALCLINAAPGLYGKYYSRALERNEQIPAYWKRAISDLNRGSHATRVLDLPGADFATYRWGDTRDPIEPGLMDRPFVARELVPWGSEPSANLLQALDRRVQEEEAEPAALAPVSRLMGVGDVVLRMDLATDRWTLVPSEKLWQTFGVNGTPGLSPAKRYGSKIPGRLTFPDPGDLTKPAADAPKPPPVAVMHVKNPIPIVRAKSAASPMVIDGDGEGLLDVAGGGLLDPERLLLYAAPFQHDPGKLRALPTSTALVVTDSNRRRGLRWSGLRDDYGYTEQAGEKPLLSDPSDQRLEVFPTSTDAAKTVSVLAGVKSVRATRYGSTFNFQPEDRPAGAFDGDLDTSWLVDDGSKVGHHRLELELTHPITTDHLDLVQFFHDPLDEKPLKRFITRIGVSFDGGPAIQRTLNLSSRTAAGQVLRFPRRTFSKLTLSFNGVPEGLARTAQARNPVGFTEIRLADAAPGAPPVRVTETMRMPRTLLTALGTRSEQHPLAVVMSRESTMDRATLSREFDLPTARTFSFSGTAVLTKNGDDGAIDTSFGLPDANSGGLTATSSSRLEQPAARASSALDGDPTTAWQTHLQVTRGQIHVVLPQPVTLDHLDLQVMADGRHSLPQRIAVIGEDGTSRIVDLPAIPLRSASGTVSVPVSFAPLTGRSFTFDTELTRPVRRGGRLMPVGIAELGIPGVRRAPMPAQLPATCIPDLITVDGKPFPVRVSGSTADALARQPLTMTPCDASETLALGSGPHILRAQLAPHNSTGFDVRRIILASAAGGAAVPAGSLSRSIGNTTGVADGAPRIHVVSQGRTSMKVRVDATSKPFWLVLGQSHNAGWTASVDGHDLGESQLVDGYANGWRVTPTKSGGPMTLTVTWAPQRTATIALWISLIAGLACVGIVIAASVRSRRRRAGTRADLAVTAAAPPPATLINPFAPSAPGFSTGATALTVGGAALAAALLVRPWVGLLVGVLTLLAIRRPRWRLVLRLGPAAIVGVITLYLGFGQYLRHYPPRFDWPTFYTAARAPAWIAVMLLVADALIEIVSRAKRRAESPAPDRRADPDPETEPEPEPVRSEP